jgi:hypothetical protein
LLGRGLQAANFGELRLAEVPSSKLTLAARSHLINIS